MMQQSWYQSPQSHKVTHDTPIKWGKYKGKKHVYLLHDRTYANWIMQRTEANFAKSTKLYLSKNGIRLK